MTPAAPGEASIGIFISGLRGSSFFIPRLLQTVLHAAPRIGLQTLGRMRNRVVFWGVGALACPRGINDLPLASSACCSVWKTENKLVGGFPRLELSAENISVLGH